MKPFFSIITVTYNDAWGLSRTARSVFRQVFKNFEYIIIDGASLDGTSCLIDFWSSKGLVTIGVSEPDLGVYNAMNKGLLYANGLYVCFLNSCDVFADDDTLLKVHELLIDGKNDGLLGWGKLNGMIWASWIGSEAFKLSSLGFCHQALFVKRELLLIHNFDERLFKTDSDTLQLGRLYASNAKILIIPEILAMRGGGEGISANLERTKISIINTIVEEYSELDESDANDILMFRRECANPHKIMKLINRVSLNLRQHLAFMIMDTLFLKQSKKLNDSDISSLYDSVNWALITTQNVKLIDQFMHAQNIKKTLIDQSQNLKRDLDNRICELRNQEMARIQKIQQNRTGIGLKNNNFIVSLTSFPERIESLDLVIQSLFEQTLQPKEIHIWLGKDEIPNRSWLPKNILKYEKKGLYVHFVEKTCHQYDKYIHNTLLNNKYPFVIVDDDVIYPPDSMENLFMVSKEYPSVVVANRAHLIDINIVGDIEPYNLWSKEVHVKYPCLRVMPTGVGGVLYPIGFLNESMVSNSQLILSYAPYADDIWLKVCALARGIPTMTTALSQKSNWYLQYTPTMKANALHTTNVELGLNDFQIKRCFEWLTIIRPDWRKELMSDKVIMCL